MGQYGSEPVRGPARPGFDKARQPDCAPAFPILAASGAMAGQLEKVRTAMTRLREFFLCPSAFKLKELFSFRQSEDIARWAGGLCKAALPG